MVEKGQYLNQIRVINSSTIHKQGAIFPRQFKPGFPPFSRHYSPAIIQLSSYWFLRKEASKPITPARIILSRSRFPETARYSPNLD